MSFAGLLLALALGSVQRLGVMPGLGRRPEGGDQSPATPTATSASPAFDARTAFPGCVHRVLDQGSCGSCWSFAATEALSDRFCIRSHGAVNVTLSPGDLLSCEKLNLGCTMGSLPEWAWAFLESDGVRTEACIPYSSETGHTQNCDKNKTSCTGSVADSTHYYAANYTHCGGGQSGGARVAAIQACLLAGPVDATFNVYENFYLSAGRGAVYRKGKHPGAYKGLHSVKVVGWGTQNSTDYWTVQNSWGAGWGTEAGFFKIARGSNECGFEELMYTGDPRL